MEFKNLKVIGTEEEFWQQLKIYEKKMSFLIKKIKLFWNNPTEYINQFETLLKEMVYIKLLRQEQADKYRTKLYTEMANPKAKQYVTNKIEKIKSKINKLKGKKQEQ